jgi:predicted DNA-binding transcriptional regulator AlpA
MTKTTDDESATTGEPKLKKTKSIIEARYRPGEDVRAYFGDKSRQWLWQTLARDPRFPRPVYFGSKKPMFDFPAVKEWAALCAAESEAKAKTKVREAAKLAEDVQNVFVSRSTRREVVS